MPHQPQSDLYSLLGLVVWGDLGSTTIYHTRRGALVSYAKTWPKQAPSPLQLLQRQRIIDAAAAWRALTPTQHAQWELATRRASLAMTGYGLYVHYHTTGDTPAVRTLERQTNTTLL